MIAIAVISLAAAAAAIYAVNKRESFLIHTYAYLTVCVVLMQVILGAIAFGSMSGTSAQLDHGWDAWRNTPEDRARLQELQGDFQCCGFNSMDDRAVDPCPNVVRGLPSPVGPTPACPYPSLPQEDKKDLPGCYHQLEHNIDAQLTTLGSLGVVASLLQLGAIMLAHTIAASMDSNNAAVEDEEDAKMV